MEIPTLAVAGLLVFDAGVGALFVRRRLSATGRRRRRRVRAVARAAERVTVVFQPVLDLRTGEVAGYEALSRFPSGGPAEWFAEAHQLGVGIDLEMAAIVQAVALRRPEWGFVSINASPSTIVSSAFTDLVGRLAAPERLVIELTEHAAVENYEQLRETLGRLRLRGIRVAIDDAGSGISSFRHVLTLAPEMLKLDRSLIIELERDEPRRALAESLVQFATRVGAQLVAEGIERPEEQAACLELGITYGQGFLLGRPQPIEELL